MKSPYNSIINFNKLKQLPRFNDVNQYSLYEKIHGQNLSFRINKSDKEVRTRRVIIGAYNKYTLHECSLVTPEICRSIMHFFNAFAANSEDEIIIYYGELFGGYYNNEKGSRKIIQHGVEYDEDHRFLVFDISINDKFIEPDILHKLIEEHANLFATPRIVFNTIAEVLEFINKNLNSTESKVYSLYGNKKIENNFVEGFILRIDNDPDIRIKFISKFNESKRKRKLIDNNRLNLIDDIYNNFNINLIIEKSLGKLNIDLNNKEDKSMFKELIDMLFQELNDELKFESQDDINLLKSISSKLFGNYYKETILHKRAIND